MKSLALILVALFVVVPASAAKLPHRDLDGQPMNPIPYLNLVGGLPAQYPPYWSELGSKIGKMKTITAVFCSPACGTAVDAYVASINASCSPGQVIHFNGYSKVNAGFVHLLLDYQ
ncbi:hypothetical protein BDK51DRAFT_29293, partial [Blyttiomyces helicus]